MAKKTLTLKKPDAAMVSGDDAAADPGDDNPPAATMATLPGARMAVGGGSPSYTAAAICALIAVVLLGALLALQFFEDTSYKGVIPLKSAMIPAP